MKKWLPFGALLLIVLIAILFFVSYPKNEKALGSIKSFGTDVPIVQIVLGDMNIDDFRESWKDVVIEGASMTTESLGMIRKYDNVRISGRGNSSWMTDKKPFQVKLAKKDDFLGLGKAKKWVYVANAYDGSYLRNDTAYMLAEMLGENVNRRGRFAEVFLNDSYEGLYYVVHRIEIGKNTVDLRDIHGVLVELDNIHNDAEICYRSYAKNCIVLQDAVAKDDPEQADIAIRDFMRDFNKLEVAAEKGDYSEVEKLIDIQSFIDYYLINEFSVNPDAYASSFYMYRNGDGDKIHAGPVWDFDLAFGSKAWSWTKEELAQLTTQTMLREDEVFGRGDHDADMSTARLFYYLMKMPEFKKEVNRTFTERLYGREAELETEILKTKEMIETAALRDNSRWDNDDRGEFNYEVDELVKFIRERYEYFEKEYKL